MKRYLAFSGDNYYPGGGWNDYKGSEDSLEMAKLLCDGEWGHIVNSETEREVAWFCNARAWFQNE